MPVPVDELTDDESFPVTPDTNEYEALDFLVRHHEYGFSPREIADRTDINESSVAKTMRRLDEKDLVERSDGIYYVDPVRVETLTARLKSVDAVVRLFEATPDDDAYAEAGWEEQVPTIDSTGGSDTSSFD
ncbi:helix-turn-helix domain-containing protein [Halobacterium salinarum]|uniref:DNA-binding transcriptional regulator, MarR family n=1 Tax=Halobacterium salinarum (strain ATCC 33171 / DSM 3754 / JCM 8978 / NBRC 102687 / NCIMB 764 / 91-R6) TaxID=2597657 RepID=A0A4D6H030_HALS9|nr:helix-turn-helix domain-containing protein [Halobacterium salinarum]MDL0131933.1 helix-turn-helix domain-containing protein [Halobacterium salinarum]MDL0134778.1 helix-turn-helix domain-containing protein [Halobacterium salinarum]MDL0144716.1 helix-turn-helix domain-containing protein [Halobacterium salinarum]QCC46137.1 HTH domain protein [Halobacterium salinarum]TYO71838.1 DNA-binding transcriptional regulator, MarR family [Halobacterium salinarum DSM 3754]